MRVGVFKSGSLVMFITGLICGAVLWEFLFSRESIASHNRESVLREQVHSWRDLAGDREKEIWELQSQLEGDK